MIKSFNRGIFPQLFRRFKKNTMDEDFRNSKRKLASYVHGSRGEEWEKAFSKYLAEVKYPPVKDFQKGLEWFNVPKPISFKEDLRGKLVLMDFFTYCCINCMHILPDLKEIEEEFSVEDGLVVIGVHSAKFQNEKISSNILAAVQRYNIKHPVVNDVEMDMWRSCGVYCWPSLMLVGPDANPIVLLTGEGHKEELKLYIRNALKYYKAQGAISDHKISMKSVYHFLPEQKGPLLFPGKITNYLRKDSEEIFAVSDSGNNRVLIFNKDGKILKQIGSSKMGLKDGSLEEAQFNSPQGLVFYDENKIYVADTENHAIRLVDLSENTVETVAGTGTQNHSDYSGGSLAKEQLLSSPWDLSLFKTKEGCEVLLIAMAGTHQLWGLFFQTTNWWRNKSALAGTCLAIAGSGREENRNNAYPHTAGFAQPSGLALCKRTNELYIADSESSSIRRVSLIDGKVSAVVGGKEDPKNLFGFGDVDGKLYNAKLQHALGVAISTDDSHLFVADTYNHKIKIVDISNNTVSTLSPPKLKEDGAHTIFREPGGLCMSLTESKLYIADTNNHCIKVAELDSSYKITKLNYLKLTSSDDLKTSFKFNGDMVKSTPVSLTKDGGKISVVVLVKLLDGLKLTENQQQNWVVELPNAAYSCVPKSGDNLKNLEMFVNIPPNHDISRACITVVFNLMTCTDTACVPKQFAIEIPLVEATNGVKDQNKLVTVNVKLESVEII